jgi:hypothetical protein
MLTIFFGDQYFNQTSSSDQKLLVTQYPFIELGDQIFLVTKSNNRNFSIASQKNLVSAQIVFGCYPEIWSLPKTNLGATQKFQSSN